MFFLCDYRINLIPLTLNKLNLSIVYFAVHKSTERIVHLLPSTAFKWCYLVGIVHSLLSVVGLCKMQISSEVDSKVLQ